MATVGAPDELRRETLAQHGADAAAADELIRFNANGLAEKPPAGLPGFPLDDEPHIEAWRAYHRAAEADGAWSALQRPIVQLRFPIAAGMSQTDAYRRATRRGEAPDGEGGLEISEPQGFELELHRSIAGTVPILVPGPRADFETLVQAFTARNEPRPVPPSMGACLVAGFNNWDRVHDYRKRWHEADPESHTDAVWSAELKRLIPRKELYQDRFIILSRGPYSGVSGADLGLDGGDWLRASHLIRREHECTHYFTLRVFGRLGHSVLEELIADFVGLIAAFGTYRVDLVERFLGLEGFPEYRAGGRLENYRGEPPISDAAFVVLTRLTHAAVRNLEKVAEAHAAAVASPAALPAVVAALTCLTLEELAAGHTAERVAQRMAALSRG